MLLPFDAPGVALLQSLTEGEGGVQPILGELFGRLRLEIPGLGSRAARGGLSGARPGRCPAPGHLLGLFQLLDQPGQDARQPRPREPGLPGRSIHVPGWS